MNKILIIFGSKSDEDVYKQITDVLDAENLQYEIRICSAHRTPEELDAILEETNADVIITGAGLAAHLPGVVASKTLKPVIGVPVSGNYEGLDAMLSIMQMPCGIPVMSTGVDKAAVAAKMAVLMLKKYEKIHIFGEETKSMKSCLAILKEFKVDFEINPDFEVHSLNIRFVGLDEPAEERDDLIIYVPIMGKNDYSAEAALNILKNSTNGLWVGLNNGENAALAAIEILNISNRYSENLQEYRKKQAKKVIEHDKEARHDSRKRH